MYTLLMQEKATSKTKVVKQIMPTGQLSGLKATRANQPFFITLNSKQDDHNYLRDLEILTRNLQHYHLYLVPLNKAITICKMLNTSMTTNTKLLREYLVDFTQPSAILDKFTNISMQLNAMSHDQRNAPKNIENHQDTSKVDYPTSSQDNIISDQPNDTTIQEEDQNKKNIIASKKTEHSSSIQPNNRNNGRTNLFTEQQIDWEMFHKMGLNRQDLVDLNLLGTLLRGFKSNCLVPIRLNLHSMICNMEARISLKHDENGQVVIVIHTIKKEPILHLPFFGHEFSKQDKANLLSSGNMGRVVNLHHRVTGEEVPSIVSLDKLTNHVIALAVDKIKLPEKLKDTLLTAEQKRVLYRGEAVYMKGLVSKSNATFNAYIQFNADRRALQYFFEDPIKLGVIKEQHLTIPTFYRNIQLTLDQQDQLSRGKSVFVEQVTDNNGRLFTGYIVYNSQNGGFDFSEQDPLTEP